MAVVNALFPTRRGGVPRPITTYGLELVELANARNDPLVSMSRRRFPAVPMTQEWLRHLVICEILGEVHNIGRPSTAVENPDKVKKINFKSLDEYALLPFKDRGNEIHDGLEEPAG